MIGRRQLVMIRDEAFVVGVLVLGSALLGAQLGALWAWATYPKEWPA